MEGTTTFRNGKIAVLRVARQYLDQGWTQGSFARNALGEPVTYDDDDACQWCMAGAIAAAQRNMGKIVDIRECTRLIHNVLSEMGEDAPFIADYNDVPGRTAEEVRHVMDMAILKLDSE